ncbi:MAG: hypothetical protein DWQ01_08290 [Planctomycetota bacterium]|nr:MAG: hypothetical protein DWQ01_08290 [Planctomycetota bacterium]
MFKDRSILLGICLAFFLLSLSLSAQPAVQKQGAFVITVKGPGDKDTGSNQAGDLSFGMRYWPLKGPPGDPSTVKPKTVFIDGMPIPSGTSPASAARMLEEMLKVKGVDPANLWVHDGTLLISQGVESAGYHQGKIDGLSASGAVFDGARGANSSNLIMFKKGAKKDGDWKTGLGSFRYFVTGLDAQGRPAAEPDVLRVAIKEGLSESQLDQILLSAFQANGWVVSLLEPGNLRIERGPTVSEIRTVQTFTHGEPGFLPLGGPVP